MPLSDYRSKQELHKAVQKVYGGGLVIDCDYYFKNYVSCYDNWYDEATNSLNIPTANIGGYADFTQQDPRFGEKETRTECLLKIDSYLDDRIFIGDSGIIFTLISPEDIKNCKFENATFDWDCYLILKRKLYILGYKVFNFSYNSFLNFVFLIYYLYSR